jgi:hypothetical protein
MKQVLHIGATHRQILAIAAGIFLALLALTSKANEIKSADADKMFDIFNSILGLRDQIRHSQTSELSDKDMNSAKHYLCLVELNEVANVATFDTLHLSESLALSAEMLHEDDEAIANKFVNVEVSEILKHLRPKRVIVNNAAKVCADDVNILGYIDRYNDFENKLMPILADLEERVKAKEAIDPVPPHRHHDNSPLKLP